MTDFVHLWVWELSTKPTVFSHMAGDIFSVKPFQSFNNNTFLHIVHSVLRENLCKLLQSPVKDNSHSPLQEYLDRKIMSTERRKMVWTQEWHTFIEKDHLGDWCPDKNCCWQLTFWQPVQKPSSSWLWRWLPLRLSKCQSPTTFLLKTLVTQMIFFNPGSNELLAKYIFS